MKKHLIRNLFLLFSFLPFIETFANWNSFIINFDKNLYGKGAQTWKIAPYDDKWVFLPIRTVCYNSTAMRGTFSR